MLTGNTVSWPCRRFGLKVAMVRCAESMKRVLELVGFSESGSADVKGSLVFFRIVSSSVADSRPSGLLHASLIKLGLKKGLH